ncbi:DUF5673 domain-containing protein [Anaerorhabdus sp.]|uniref:DUF5673 domain-containing protein n=1 Tax=Anaerorhabdus sp. TaxID=1872524 RepID=UPI002FC5C656
MDFFNLVLTGIFLAIAFWLSFKLVKMKKTVKVYGKFLTLTRIMFFIALVFAIITIFIYWGNVGEMVRSVIMCFAISMFILLQDGITDDGFFLVGNFVAFNDVIDYDYKKEKNKFIVFFSYKDGKQKSGSFQTEVVFDIKKADEVEKELKDKIGKKYRRMKK